MDCHIAEAAFPTEGAVAGDTFIVTFVKICYLDDLDRYAAKWPHVQLSVCYDDLIPAEFGSRMWIRHAYHKAAADLTRCATEDIQGDLSFGKAALATSCPELYDALADKIGEAVGPRTTVSPYRGVDVADGTRAKSAGSRKSRWARRRAAGVARRSRLRRLRAACGRAKRIYVSGVQLAMTYGAEVVGVADNEVKELRSVAAACMQPSTRGRSLSALFALQGGPALRPAMAPAMRWALEAWIAVTEGAAGGRHFSLETMRELWDDARPQDATTWRRSRGPLDGAMLSLRRLGWECDGPFHWIDDRGVRIDIATTPPAMLKILVADGSRRLWERRAADSAAKHGLTGKRLCFDAAARCSKLKTGAAIREGQLAAMRCVCDGTWTATRADAAGYAVETTLRALCNDADDAVFHRLYLCQAPEAVEARKATACGLVKHALAGRGNILYTRAIFEFPDEVPAPLVEGGVDCIRYDLDASGMTHGEVPANLGGGTCYVDGSCTTHIVKDLRRASWCAHFVGTDGKPVACVAGPVWIGLPQTAQAGENVSMAAALQLITCPTDIAGDCLSVVKAMNEPGLKRITRHRAYAGVAWPGLKSEGARCVRSCRWMRSHQVAGAETSPAERADIDGNDVADAGAKGITDAPRYRAELKEAAKTAKTAVDVFHLMEAVLPCWPALPRSERTKAGGMKRAYLDGHSWAASPSGWRCSLRGATHAATGGAPPPLGICTPHITAARAAMACKLGHELDVLSQDGAPLPFCATCGRYGINHCHRLLAPCLGAPSGAAARHQLGFMLNGCHPLTGRALGWHPLRPSTRPCMGAAASQPVRRRARRPGRRRPRAGPAVGLPTPRIVVRAKHGVAAKLAKAAGARALDLGSFTTDGLAGHPLEAERLSEAPTNLHRDLRPAPPPVGIDAKLASLRERIKKREEEARCVAADAGWPMPWACGYRRVQRLPPCLQTRHFIHRD